MLTNDRLLMLEPHICDLAMFYSDAEVGAYKIGFRDALARAASVSAEECLPDNLPFKTKMVQAFEYKNEYYANVSELAATIQEDIKQNLLILAKSGSFEERKKLVRELSKLYDLLEAACSIKNWRNENA